MSGKFRGEIQRKERLASFASRQEAGLPALSDEDQQKVSRSVTSQGFGSPFGGGVDPSINKQPALTAIPQYDTSANSAYRQQMSLRKVRANKL